MFGTLFLPFKRRKAAATEKVELPTTVTEAIGAASILIRSANEDGPRIVFMWNGRGFLYSDESAATVVSRSFPELNNHQISLAQQRMRMRVRAHLKEIARVNTEPEHRPWRDRY